MKTEELYARILTVIRKELLDWSIGEIEGENTIGLESPDGEEWFVTIEEA